MAMAQAVEPYLAWLRTTAQQCEQIASSVQAVIAAFELTHFTVVHPVTGQCQPDAAGSVAGH